MAFANGVATEFWRIQLRLWSLSFISASTINRTNSANVTVGFQPSFCRA